MPIFAVSTIDGKTIMLESEQATAGDLTRMARAEGHIEINEIVAATGRDVTGYKHPVAIPYHAIVAIRPKR